MGSVPDMFDSRARIIDLFAGPGGMDVGAAWLGIPAEGVELDDNACATRVAAGLGTKQGDVRDFGPEDFPDATVLTGGPPCQTFTVAGSGSGRKALDRVIALTERMADGHDAADSLTAFEDERTGLVLEPMRWALEALRADAPYQAIVLEQVPQVLPIWAMFRKVLERFGYGVDHGVLRTEEFGVPQTRRRAVLVARLDDESVSLPEPSHHAFRRGKPREAGQDRKAWVSMADALDRDTSFTVISNYGSGGNPRDRGRRHSDEPAATVTGKIMRNRLEFEGADDDRFTIREAGVLQTFPPDYPWAGKDVGQQIGNAVPPRLAVHVLAAALDLAVDDNALDRAVRAPWAVSQEVGVVLSRRERAESPALV
ncbi:DNA cytosine methyltransferase [Gordonia hongkongensis]|uniref:DNA (cytosine-5-)-methyltransferase n=1 Tax=Gordonia hongkongensis TaxID=1701090 RepID=A0ABT6C042_9ACTN|nr:DNA cytosine methyltransferase [Gordonia hongkongensis]MDF6103649.1 DNA cytosine methyltransferase [Gordonia hongkongensis]